ncbi:MAG: FAD-dependent oxidoreductase [Pseudomonadota bacterium]
MSHDVVIVGSGPLGMATARRLAERGAKVLVLEQGKAISDPPGTHYRNSEQFLKHPDSYLPAATHFLQFLDDSVPRDALPGAAVTRTVGGQGVIWTNLCPRSDALWAMMDDAAWSERYQLAEEYLSVQTDTLDRSVRQERVRAELEDFVAHTDREVTALPVAGRFGDDGVLRFTGSADILNVSAAARENVALRHDQVRRIHVARDRVQHLEAESGSVTADSYVIAGGAIDTPHLLFRSGIRPAALGRYLSYHPLSVCQVVLAPEFCSEEGTKDFDPRIQVRPASEAPWYTIVVHDVSPFEPKGDDANADPSRLVEIQSICPVDNEEHKRALFHEDGRVTFDVPLSDADQHRMKDAVAEAHAITDRIGRFREFCAPTWMPFGFAHMTGTTRMSETDDGTGVADYEGRVWGFDNLYLATNGLIPTRMSVNPTLTGVSLAIHIADKIHDQ